MTEGMQTSSTAKARMVALTGAVVEAGLSPIKEL